MFSISLVEYAKLPVGFIDPLYGIDDQLIAKHTV
jgi:hypothetical protein